MNNPEQEVAPRRMTSEEPASSRAESLRLDPGSFIWGRIRQHKVVEWSLAYVAFGYAALHGSQMLRETLDWPAAVPRFTLFALLLGFPIAATLAWYHGHRARKRVSAVELTILVALLLAAGSILWWLSSAASTHAGSSSVREAPPMAPRLGDKSIAVLPFVDLSERQNQEYFASGLAEEILNQLAKIPALKVIGRTSSFQFKGKTADLRQIGAVLGVAYVLEGGVLRDGDHIRVTAQLITTGDGTQRWSDTYDRNVSDLLAVQDEIAAGLARALQLEVANPVTALPRRTSPEAYDSYLRGLHVRDRYDQEGFEEAVADFRHSLELDPEFISAAEALAYTLQSTTAWGFLSADKGSEEARAAAARALAIDPNSALAHAVLCAVHVQYDFDWSAAGRECTAAERLAPHQPAILKESSLQHMAVGETVQAAYSIEAALALDPLDPNSYDRAWLIYMRAGRIPEAERAMRRCLSISPTYAFGHFLLAVSLLFQGRPDAALAEFQKEAVPEGKLFGFALAYHALQRTKEADASVRELETKYPDRAFDLAEAYAYQGKIDRALMWLDRALRDRDAEMFTVRGEPLLENLRNDPRYKEVLRKMNLEQ